jgi:hypothetical protein
MPMDWGLARDYAARDVHLGETRVTEAEWLKASEPREMLEFIGSRASDRKLRLLACACCRRVWHLANAPGRVAVETAERFADGQATGEELEVARRKATIDDWAELTRLRGTPADAHENSPDWNPEEVTDKCRPYVGTGRGGLHRLKTYVLPFGTGCPV